MFKGYANSRAILAQEGMLFFFFFKVVQLHATMETVKMNKTYHNIFQSCL